MGKIVKKILLDDDWSIAKNESWFSDMAAKGYHLKEFGKIFAHFKKGKPQNKKYRIDILKEKPSREQLELYQDCGWDFVTSRREFFIFSSPENLNSLEIHTDPIEQSFTLNDINRRLRNIVIILSILMIAFFCMVFSLFFFQRGVYLSIVEGETVQIGLVILVELYAFYVLIRNYRSVRNLRKSLSEGRPMNHEADWEKGRFINGVISIFFLAIALISLFLPIIQISKSTDYTLPESQTNLPIVRLDELEQDPNLRREVRYHNLGIDWGNRVRYDWGPLAPVHYEVEEHGIVDNRMWEDKSGTYSPSIHTQFYELMIPQMTVGFIQNLMDRYLYEPGVKVQKMENTQFDEVYTAVDGIEKQIFVSLKNKVIYMRYYGNENIDRILPLIFEKFTSY